MWSHFNRPIYCSISIGKKCAIYQARLQLLMIELVIRFIQTNIQIQIQIIYWSQMHIQLTFFQIYAIWIF